MPSPTQTRSSPESDARFGGWMLPGMAERPVGALWVSWTPLTAIGAVPPRRAPASATGVAATPLGGKPGLHPRILLACADTRPER